MAIPISHAWQNPKSLTYQLVRILGSISTELDYWDFDTPGPGGSKLWSTGLFASYNITEKLGLGLRSEFMSDPDGTGTAGALGFATAPGTPPALAIGLSNNAGQDIFSTAFTLNIKPVPYVKIQPEIRYDHSTLVGAFGRQRDRVFLGAGVSYLF